MEETIRAQLQAHRELMEAIEEKLTPAIALACDLLAKSLASGKKVLIMGNGGSAADAQHFAAELVGRFKLERRGLPAIALTTDTSLLTAIGNDYGFEAIFRRQIEALASAGDVVVGISTSGSSANVLEALLLAGEIGCARIGLLGRDGGAIRDCVEIALTVPGHDTPRIQEGHITIIHIICDLVEKALFTQKATG